MRHLILLTNRKRKVVIFIGVGSDEMQREFSKDNSIAVVLDRLSEKPEEWTHTTTSSRNDGERGSEYMLTSESNAVSNISEETIETIQNVAISEDPPEEEPDPYPSARYDKVPKSRS